VSILLDTNVLLRRVQPSHPRHAFAVDSVARLLAAGEAAHFTLQHRRVLERRDAPGGA
jgi:hypothetical protein